MGEGGRGAPGPAVGAGRTCRIGCGAGFSNDRIEPARDLAERGALDFLVFECLAERTLAQAHAARRLDPAAGFDPRLRVRLEAVLAACHANGTRIVTNAGSANPRAAGAAAREVARALGLGGLRIAVVEGDDVAHLLTPDLPLIEPEASLLALDERRSAPMPIWARPRSWRRSTPAPIWSSPAAARTLRWSWGRSSTTSGGPRRIGR